jgi:hypothetical protein
MRTTASTETAGTGMPQPPAAEPRLSGGWLLAARVGWLLTALLIVGLNVYSAPVAYQQAQVICTGSECAYSSVSQVTSDQARQLAAAGLSLQFYAAYIITLDLLGMLLCYAIAAAVFWLRSDDHMALFAAYMLVVFGGVGAFGTVQALPLADARWTLPIAFANAVGQVAFYVFFCLFPSGHFVPRWLVWPTLLWSAIWLGSLLLPAAINPLAQATVTFVIFVLLLVFAQIYRYRRVSSPSEREKTKWVVFGFALGIGGFCVMLVIGNLTLPAGQADAMPGQLVAQTILSVLIWLVPIFIGIAILRSRLWDIDVLIRRTLIYATLTAILAGIYFAVVLIAQVVGEHLTRQTQPPAWLIVVTTLAVAAFFMPLRWRIQRVIDRRFYRSRYDATRTVEAFAATLRTEVDLSDVSEHLIGVVEQTMRPAQISLWLRERAGSEARR